MLGIKYDPENKASIDSLTLYISVLFEPHKQIGVSCAMFKVTSFINFVPYLVI